MTCFGQWAKRTRRWSTCNSTTVSLFTKMWWIYVWGLSSHEVYEVTAYVFSSHELVGVTSECCCRWKGWARGWHMDTHTWRQRLHIVPAMSIVSQLLISLQGEQGLLFLTLMWPTEPYLVSLRSWLLSIGGIRHGGRQRWRMSKHFWRHLSPPKMHSLTMASTGQDDHKGTWYK